MKTLSEILKQEPVFNGIWETKIDIISDFDDIYMTDSEYNAKTPPYKNVELWEEKKVMMRNSIEQWKYINILFASYGNDNYSGNAWVLFETDGKIYEVNGSHCSCYGLEGQWGPEETTLEAIKKRLKDGGLGSDDYSDNCFKSKLEIFLGLHK